jgi:hypothetical protein
MLRAKISQSAKIGSTFDRMKSARRMDDFLMAART